MRRTRPGPCRRSGCRSGSDEVGACSGSCSCFPAGLGPPMRARDRCGASALPRDHALRSERDGERGRVCRAVSEAGTLIDAFSRPRTSTRHSGTFPPPTAPWTTTKPPPTSGAYPWTSATSATSTDSTAPEARLTAQRHAVSPPAARRRCARRHPEPSCVTGPGAGDDRDADTFGARARPRRGVVATGAALRCPAPSSKRRQWYRLLLGRNGPSERERSTSHIASSISPTGSALSLRKHRRDTWLCTGTTAAAMSSALSDVD